MRVLCTICARAGSVGVKNKNIRSLRGKPLIAHSLIQAKKTNLFSFIVVSSDSPKIGNISKKWGANHVIQRPAELATATISKIPAIQHAVLESENFYKEKFDFIIDLDATAPLRTVDDIVAAFNMLLAHPTADNLVTACPARKSPYFNMLEVGENGFVGLVKRQEHLISRRQDTPACYDMNASIYVWKRAALLDSKSAIAERTLLYVMPEERSIDIDTMLDWDLVKFLSKSRKDL